MLVAADTSVRLWRKDGGTPLTIRKPQHARYIALSVAGRALVVTRDEGRALEVIGLNTRSAAPMILHAGRSITNGSARPRTLAFSNQGPQLLSSEGMANATLWNTETASIEGTAKWPKTALAVAPTKNGGYVAALGDGSLIEAQTSGAEPSTLLEPDASDALSPLSRTEALANRRRFPRWSGRRLERTAGQLSGPMHRPRLRSGNAEGSFLPTPPSGHSRHQRRTTASCPGPE